MFTVRIMNEYLHGPVWVLDEEGISVAEGALPLVEEDAIVQKANDEAGALFDSYYEFDSHDQACWFNEEQERADKEKMLSMLAALVARLEELNDGSYVIEDLETPRVQAL